MAKGSVLNITPHSTGTPELTLRKERFRQRRYNNESENLTISIAGEEGRLINWSRTGLAFSSAASYKTGETVSGVKICCGEIVIFEGEVEIKSVRREADGPPTYGASFSSSLFWVEGIASAVSVNEAASDMQEVTEQITEAKPEFFQLIVTLSAALRRLRAACLKEEDRWRLMPFDRRQEAERIFLPNMSDKVKFLFTDLNIRIAKTIDVESLPDHSIYHRVAQEEIYPFFVGADLARRVHDKPRGYAGDYEMMNQIYRSGYEGSDLFGRVLHNYIANENSGESVKFRKPYLYEKLCQQLTESAGERRILSIASGPAVEYQEAVANWSAEDLARIEATLFDLDHEALEHSQSRIIEIARKRNLEPNVVFINAGVKSFLAVNMQNNESYDLIYSAGLFDYLDNFTAGALVRSLYGMLKPGGKLIVGNFTKDNLTKAFLHLLAKWVLIHKTESEIRGWAEGLPGGSLRVEYDTLKMFAFLVINKE